MTNYINKWNKFWKGFSLDDFLASEGQFLYGENIDSSHSGYGITLGPKAINYSLDFSSGEYVIGFHIYSTNQYIITTSLNRILYINNGVLITDYDNGSPILSSYLLGINLIIISDEFSGDNIYRITANNVIAGTIAGNKHLITTLGKGRLETPFYLSKNSLYLGLGNGILQITGTGFTLPTYTNYYNLTAGRIYGIGKTDANFKLYDTVDGLVFWDGVSAENNGSVQIGVKRGLGYSYNYTDYIIDYNGGINIVQNYDLIELLKKRVDSQSNIIGETICSFNSIPNILTFSKDTIFAGSNDTKPGIYQFKELIKGLGQGASKIVTDINGNTFTEIKGVWYDYITGKLFFSYLASGTQGLAYIDLDGERNDSGFFITQILNGNNLDYKTLREIRLVGKNLGDTRIYARIDEEEDWTLLYSIPEGTKSITIGADEINLNKFNEIQFKVVFEKQTTGSKFPYINGFQALFDKNEE